VCAICKMVWSCTTSCHQFIACGKDSHSYLGHDTDLAQAQGGQNTDLLGFQATTGRQDDLAGPGVIPAPSHVAAWRHTACHQPRFIIDLFDILDHDHGIGSRRQHTAGGHAEAGAGSQRLCSHLAHRDLASPI